MNRVDHPIINTLGLCSGIGMLEEAVRLGCEFFGWRAKPTCLAEWESYAAATLLARMEESSLEPCPIWCGDLRDFDAKPFRGVVDILTAGLPCQPYSVAGKQKGNEDERSHGEDGDGPIVQFLRIVEECRPAVVFCENVPPWVSGGWFRPVGEELSRLGYTVESPLFVTAESVGASHRRERVFVLAHAGHGFDWGKGRGESGGRSELGGECRNVAHAISAGQQKRGSERANAIEEFQAIERNSPAALFAPGPTADWGQITEMLYPATEPGFRVLVDGLALVVDEGRADQLRCGGNGVVATAAAVAFVELMRRVIS